MWVPGLIAVVVVIAIALISVVVMITWAHIVPPMEAEPTRAGLRVQVNRAVLRNVEISVDGGPFVAVADLQRGETIVPWSRLGDSGDLIDFATVRQVHARGRSSFASFETTLDFNLSAEVSATSQTLNYVGTASD